MRFVLRVAVACAVAMSGTLDGQTRSTTGATAIPSALTLARANEILMQQSPAILAEAQSIAAAKAEIETASKLPNPSVFGNSESYPIFSSHPGSFLNNQELTGTASQVIQTAGKRGKRLAVARQALTVAGSNVEDFKRQLQLELRQRYWATVLAGSQAALARQLLAQFDETLRLNEARYQEGEISGLEALRLRSERLRFWNDVQQAELDVKTAKAALLELLAAPQDTHFDATDVLQTVVSVEPLQDLMSEALTFRPDLKAEREAVLRQDREAQYQRALAIPDVTVGAGYKRDFGNSTPVVNITIPIPVFNRNQGGVHAADAELFRQRQLAAVKDLEVQRQVKQAFETVVTQQERANQMREAYAPTAQKALDIAVQSYRLGSLDLLGLLDAQRVYRETERSVIQADFDLRMAESSLEAAVGKEFLP